MFLDRDRRRLFELAPSMGLGLDEKGGGGGRRVGLILLFQCGGREWGVAVADEKGEIGSGIWVF